MANLTYPVAGYRTKSARAKAFKPPQAPSKAVEDLMRRALEPPWGPRGRGRSRGLTSRETRMLRDLGLILGRSAANHPALRAARMAWQINRFLRAPQGVYRQSSDLELRPGSGWTPCWGDCGPHPTRANRGVGWGSYDSATCSSNLQCLNNQGDYPGQPPLGTAHGDMAGHLGNDPEVWHAIPESNLGYCYGQGHDYIGTQDRWRYRQLFTRSAPGPIEHPLWRPKRQQLLGPEPAPMPMPWPLAAANARPDHPGRESGYGAPTPPQAGSPGPRYARRPGKRTKERKMTLMGGGILRKIVEQAFEGTEWVGIAHAALPKSCQAPPGSTIAQMAVAVYKCWPKLNACKFMEGVINNHIEDKVIGMLGQAAKKSAQGSGKAYGLSGLTKRSKLNLPFSIPKVTLGCG